VSKLASISHFLPYKHNSLLLICLNSEETYGQSSVQAAAAWYEYGNVLLLKEEENPANGVLGNVEANPNGTVPEDDEVGDEEEDNEDGAGPADGEEGETMEEEDEPEGDLQVAWEALDVRNSFLLADKANKQNMLSISFHDNSSPEAFYPSRTTHKATFYSPM